MSNGNGVSRGDRNRNARLSRLRGHAPGRMLCEKGCAVAYA